jgi:hypothetical protein
LSALTRRQSEPDPVETPVTANGLEELEAYLANFDV